MPPLTIGGLRFLGSFDDLTFVAVPSIFIHALWILVDTARLVRFALARLAISTVMLDVDAAVCGAVMALDVIVAVLSAQGAIMQPRKHETALKGWLAVRLLGGFLLFSIYGVGLAVVIAHYVRYRWLGDDPPPPSDLDDLVGGWGPVQKHWLVVLVVQLFMLSRLLVVIPGACFCVATLLPKDSHAKAMKSGIEQILHLMGVKSDMTIELVKVLSEVVGHGTSDLIAPSDVLFGITLVAAGQKQGALYLEEPASRRPKGSTMTASAERACAIQGVHQAPQPLDPGDEKDMDALRQVNHYVHFAVAIYGVSMELFTASVYEHTSIPSPTASCRALCRALPCCQERKPRAEVVKDACCGLNESALRRVLAAGARTNGTQEPELLWATWENRGPLTSPPLAVLLDHELSNVVVTVRGTMDAKDCITDMGATPTFFDPFGVAGPDDARQAPFDDRTGLFAHSTILASAEDALRRLAEAGVLEAAMGPEGRAHDWGLVCVGHSLGAGVACFLALMLRASGKPYAAKTRCVCFEPPGGLMSRRLSDLTRSLGFIAAVCANDWISRLSIRAVQELRESILDELWGCGRSKVQLSLLVCSFLARQAHENPFTRALCCCLGGRIAGALEWLGGGPLRLQHPDGVVVRKGYARVRAASLPGSVLDEMSFFPELLPPSPVLYFRPTSQAYGCCGCYQFSTEWTAEWIQPEDLHEIILSPRSAELHFPNILRDAYLAAARSFGIWEAQTSLFSSGSDSESKSAVPSGEVELESFHGAER